MESVTVVLSSLYIAPPFGAVLYVNRLSLTLIVPLLYIAPPLVSAEFFVRLHLVMLRMAQRPLFNIAPPKLSFCVPPLLSAVLFMKLESVMLRLIVLNIAPPLIFTVLFVKLELLMLLIVRLLPLENIAPPYRPALFPVKMESVTFIDASAFIAPPVAIAVLFMNFDVDTVNEPFVILIAPALLPDPRTRFSMKFVLFTITSAPVAYIAPPSPNSPWLFVKLE